MQAWRILSHGGSEALQRVEVPRPKINAGEALIRVEAVGLNHLDVWVRKGVPGHKFPLPLVPGCDTSGVIEELGPGAEAALAKRGLKVGTPVLISPGISCGLCPACLGGFDPLCPSYGILGETRDGGCTEFIAVPFANLIPRGGLSAVDAAAIPIPFLTAWTMLVRKARLEAGETVLVHAGGSGVSIAAIQIAKLLGAQVITTVGSDDKIAKARALGADHVINYKTSSFREEVKKIRKSGCEVIVDHVGEDTFQESLRTLAWGGRLVTCGATTGSNIEIDLKQVFFKNISILGATMGSKADLLKLVGLVQQGKLRPVIGATMKMDELPQALERLESRSVFGKVVLAQA
jgi:NADPH:quinone reductase-like Zn-dependent oxidoreductase